jgi:predicted restriction endonuclease
MDHHIAGGEYLNKKEAKLRFRQDILNSWDHKCAYCGDDLGRIATLDHVHPKSKGGLTTKGNLVPACFSCNISKSDVQPFSSWYQRQSFFCADKEQKILAWMRVFTDAA